MWGIIKVCRRVVTRYPIIVQATQAGKNYPAFLKY